MRKSALIPVLIAALLIGLPVFAQNATPTATPTATPADLLPFPLSAPTDAQIAAARDCSLTEETINSFSTLGAPVVGTPMFEAACSIAHHVLSLAALRRSDDAPTDLEMELLRQIATLNPALLLRNELLIPYFHEVEVVGLPEVLNQPVADVVIEYSFVGLGTYVAYDIHITDADTDHPAVSGSAEIHTDFTPGTSEPEHTLPDTVDPALVQALPASLTDLVPVSNEVSLIVCYDLYPDWTVTLTLADDTLVTVRSHESNVIGVGGPIQTMIDGQRYVQYSSRFVLTTADLLEALGLGLGDTPAYTCGRTDDTLLALAYP